MNYWLDQLHTNHTMSSSQRAGRGGTSPKPGLHVSGKSKSRSAAMSSTSKPKGKGSKGFIVSGEQEIEGQETAGGHQGSKWWQDQAQNEDEDDQIPSYDEEEEPLPPITSSSSRRRREVDNVYEMEEEEEPLNKPVSGSRSKRNEDYDADPFATRLDMEEGVEMREQEDEFDEEAEEEYEDIEEDENPPPSPPPPRQKIKSSFRRGSSRTSFRGNSNNGGGRMGDVGSSDSVRLGSSSSLVGNSRTRIGDRGSTSSLRAKSRDNLGGRRSLARSVAVAKYNNEDEDDLLGGSESVNPNDVNVGYQRASTRLGSRSGSGSRGQIGRSRRSSLSREVTALPIEIPDSVTDEDAFRRYLSVRRGANITTRPHSLFEDSKSYASVGEGGPGGRLPPAMAVRSTANANARLDTNRKTSCLCFAIVSLALLSASASQLRFVVAYSKAHAYPALNYFLICTSIIIEIVAGIGYIVVSRLPASDPRIDNIIGILIAGLFVVTINNVIISAFAFDDHVCEVLAKQTGMLDVVDQTPNQPNV